MHCTVQSLIQNSTMCVKTALKLICWHFRKISYNLKENGVLLVRSGNGSWEEWEQYSDSLGKIDIEKSVVKLEKHFHLLLPSFYIMNLYETFCNRKSGSMRYITRTTLARKSNVAKTLSHGWHGSRVTFYYLLTVITTAYDYSSRSLKSTSKSFLRTIT